MKTIANVCWIIASLSLVWATSGCIAAELSDEELAELEAMSEWDEADWRAWEALQVREDMSTSNEGDGEGEGGWPDPFKPTPGTEAPEEPEPAAMGTIGTDDVEEEGEGGWPDPFKPDPGNG